MVVRSIHSLHHSIQSTTYINHHLYQFILLCRVNSGCMSTYSNWANPIRMVHNIPPILPPSPFLLGLSLVTYTYANLEILDRASGFQAPSYPRGGRSLHHGLPHRLGGLQTLRFRSASLGMVFLVFISRLAVPDRRVFRLTSGDH